MSGRNLGEAAQGLLSASDFGRSLHPVPKDVQVCGVTLAWLIQGAFLQAQVVIPQLSPRGEVAVRCIRNCSYLLFLKVCS